jgi:hypothetical protein
MMRVVYPGSGYRFNPGFWIPDTGVKKAPNPVSRIRIRNTVLKLGLLVCR